MSARLKMEDVNTPVPTLRATLAAPVTLAMNWTSVDLTALVVSLLNVQCIYIILSFL